MLVENVKSGIDYIYQYSKNNINDLQDYKTSCYFGSPLTVLSGRIDANNGFSNVIEYLSENNQIKICCSERALILGFSIENVTKKIIVNNDCFINVEKNKILYKQAEKKQYIEKVDKLKENYLKFEKGEIKPMDTKVRPKAKAKKELTGVDVFIDWDEESRNPNVIGERLRQANANGLQLHLITNRGVKVFPEGMKETFCTDHWRCRFKTDDGSVVTHAQVLDLLQQIEKLGFDFIKTEHLYTFDGVRGYSLAQGE
jgi:hypothetical protein